VYSTDNQQVVLQTLENAYVGASMLAVMAKQQNRHDTHAECALAQKRCHETLIDAEADPDEMDFQAINTLLNGVSKLARTLWNMQMSSASEQINLRIVNDVADAERHIERPECAPEVPCPSPLGELIEHLDRNKDITDNPTPLTKLLMQNDQEMLSEGKKTMADLAHARSTQESVPAQPESPSESSQGSLKCKPGELPKEPPKKTSIDELSHWLERINAAQGLPDRNVIIDALDQCRSLPTKSRQHAVDLAEEWESQFENLPSGWADSAAEYFTHAACSTDLDTLSQSAEERVRACFEALPEPEELAEVESEESVSAGELDDLPDHSMEQLEARRERLLAELEQIDEAIDNQSSAYSSAPR
jgi:hypothetical protein